MRECASAFGDVFALKLGEQTNYIIFSRPEDLRAIFTADAEVLKVGAGNAVLQPFLGPGSLLLLEGERHVRERRLLLPAFHQKVVAGYSGIIREAVVAATSDWDAGREFVAQDVFQSVSIDVIFRTIFGLRDETAWGELKRAVVSFLNDRRFSLGLMTQLRAGAQHQQLDAFREQFVRIGQLTKAFVSDRRTDRRTDPAMPAGDMLSMLLEAKDEEGRCRSDEELRDELLTLVATGYETTATALAWGLYWTAAEPKVCERLRQEIRSLGRDPDPRAYGQLGYLDAVCKETLRIFPIVPSVFRQVERAIEVAGYRFEPGVVLSPSIYLTHHREDLYEEPDAFDPERFLTRTYSPYEYLPFGGGARRCIGMNLALHEMRIILATMVGRFDIEIARGQEVVPVRRSVTMGPSGGPRMVVRHVYR